MHIHSFSLSGDHRRDAGEAEGGGSTAPLLSALHVMKGVWHLNTFMSGAGRTFPSSFELQRCQQQQEEVVRCGAAFGQLSCPCVTNTSACLPNPWPAAPFSLSEA